LPTAEPEDASVELKTEVGEVSERTAIFREVSSDEADAVLTLRLTIPNVTEIDEYKYYLKRNLTGHSYSVGHGFAADGRTDDRRGFGYGGNISIGGDTPESVSVELSLYWTTRDSRHGEIKAAVDVPWLGEVEKRLANGAHVSARIKRLPR
jgi:hypothetical protein